MSKYHKSLRVKDGAHLRIVDVDVYDVLELFEVKNPAVQHAIKKLLMAGERGHKDKLQDLNEAGMSIERAIELETIHRPITLVES